MTSINLVIIDNHIQEYNKIINALNGHTRYILVNALVDTYDTLKTKISELALPIFSSIGIIQHNRGGSTYSLFRNADAPQASTLVNVSEVDPDLDTWTDYSNFISYLKNEYSMINFDLMACALYSDPNWKYVIDTLETQTGINIRASNDDTGSAELGGNWFLETNSVNLKDVYFTDAIDQFTGTLSIGYHSLFITSIGRVYSTGRNHQGQLGLGDTNNRNSPILITSTIGSLNIVSVACAHEHSLFLTSAGTVYSCGIGPYGGLGLSDTSSRNIPTLITNTIGSLIIVAISCGDSHSLFLTSNGQVYSTGYNTAGQLGLGDTNQRNIPTLITNTIGSLNIVAISCGDEHSLFLRNTGAVYSSGGNSWGQLGLSDTSQRNIPTLITNTIGSLNIVAISCGHSHSLFLTSTGAVYSTGYGGDGQLGLADNTNKNVPTLITTNIGNLYIKDIASGAWHSLFLTRTNAVYSTGFNGEGQLGLGDNTHRNVPTLITSNIANLNISSVSAGGFSSYFLTSSGTIYSTGRNDTGQLGLGDTNNRNVSNAVSGTYSRLADTEIPAKFVSVGFGTNTLAYSYDGINWNGNGTSIFSEYGFGVEHSAQLSRWVAVGKGTNSIAYSEDGIMWTGKGSAIFSDKGRGIAYSTKLSRWVALGNGTNSIAYSDDGITWTGIGTSIFTVEGRNVAYSAKLSRWVAVGKGTNSIAYSTNGITWTGIGASIFSTEGISISYSSELSRWVAVGYGTNSIAYSTDGITWNGIGTSIFSDYGHDVAYSSVLGRWVAVGLGTNSIAHSIDGITWTGVTSKSIFSTQGLGIAYSSELSRWVAVGDGTNSIAYSADGITWTGLGKSIFTSDGISVAALPVLYYGSSLDFDGINDNVSVSNIGTLSSLTLEVWIYHTDIANGTRYSQIVSRGANGSGWDWALYLKSSPVNTLRWVGPGITTIDTNVIPLNKWTHVAVSCNNVETKIYINGDLIQTTSTTSTMTNQTSSIMFGNDISFTRPYKGRISEVRLWNVIRTTSEIQNNYRQFLIGNETGLIGYWKLNNGSPSNNYAGGSTATDSSSSVKNGTLNNFSLSGGTSNWILDAPFEPKITLIPTLSYDATTAIQSFVDPTTTWTVPSGVTAVSALIIAGGGGGGKDNGGGGGGGGFIVNTNIAVTPGASMSILVGSGGDASASISSVAINGGNSSFAGLIAIGGGGGGSISNTAGANGGSSGGRAGNGSAQAATTTTTPLQGNNGGGTNGGYGGGGGGGAGQVGSNGGSNVGGKGGDGISSSLSGSIVYYAGGGGGGGNGGGGGAAGNGGGGAGVAYGSSTPTVGTNGLGGGGGGGGGADVAGAGARGGSGIVILSYTYNNNSYSKTFGDAPFNLTPPLSDSTGSFSYISNNTSIATISGATVTIVGAGITTITATQAASGNYTSATTTITLTVNAIAQTLGSLKFFPTKISTNLLAHYDASVLSSYTLSSSNVTQWNDLTGNGYHLIPNTTGPTITTINSVTAFNFNSNRGLKSSIIVPKSRTITLFIIIKHNSAISAYGSYVSHGNRDWDWSLRNTSGTNKLVINTSGDNSNPSLSVENNTNYIFVVRLNTDSREIWRYSDNALYADAFATAVGNTNFTYTVNGYTNLIHVGKSEVDESSQSIIGEILYYNNALSNADISTNLAYMKAKWLNISIPINFGDSPLTIMQPSSNSSGTFTYNSGNTSVGTISGNSIIIAGAGTSTITATQAAAGNYTTGNTTALLTVSPIAPTFSWGNITKNFGDSPFTVSASSNSSGNITYNSINGNVSTISGNIVTIVGAGSSTITANQIASTNYTSLNSNIILTINPIAPTLSNFGNITKNFGDADFTLTAPTSTSLGVFSYINSNTNVAIFNVGVLFQINNPTYRITVNNFPLLGSMSYWEMSIRFITTGGTNSWRPLIGDMYNPVNNNRGWGVWVSSSNGLHFSWQSQTWDASPIAVSLNTEYILKINRTPTSLTFLLTTVSTNATQTSTNTNISSYVMTTNGPVTIGGWINLTSELFPGTISNVTVKDPQFQANTIITVVGAGSTTITANQASTTNYTSGTINAVLTVNPISPNINTISNITKTFGDIPFRVSTTSNNSLGTFTYISGNISVATISDTNLLTIVGGGTSTITANISATANYTSVTTSALLTVNKAETLFNTFSSIIKTYGDAAFRVTVTSSNSSGAITYTSNNESVATISDANLVTLVGVGTSTITATIANTTNHLSASTSTTLTVNTNVPAIGPISTSELANKTFGNTSFTITQPTSNSLGVFTYISSNTGVAVISNLRNALNFDGINDYINVGIPDWSNETQFRQTMTLECWFKTNTASLQPLAFPSLVSRSYSGTVSNTSQFSLMMAGTFTPEDNGAVIFGVTSAASNIGLYINSSPLKYNDGNWHHVAATYSSSTGKASLYVDGLLVKEASNINIGLTSISHTPNIPIFIGSDAGQTIQSTNNRNFQGSIADVRIWNVVRTPTEIFNNYAMQLNGNETGLMFYNKLDQGTVGGNNSGITTTTNNMLSGGNSGTLINFALSGSISNWVSGPEPRITILGAGTTTITATQAASGNYITSFVTATLTVAKATPTFSIFSNIAKSYTDAAFRVTASTITNNSPGIFSYISGNTSIATISDTNLVSIASTGSTTITGRIAETSNYLTADISANLIINPSNPTIGVLTLPSKIFGDAPFTITQPTTNSLGVFSYTSSNASVATISNSVLFEISPSTIPVLSLPSFPSLVSVNPWTITIDFKQTSGQGQYRILLGNYWNIPDSDKGAKGWGIWVSPQNTIRFYNKNIDNSLMGVVLNINYRLIVTYNGTTYNFTLNNLDSSTSNTNNITSSNSIDTINTSIGGWSLGRSEETFIGTISYVSVSNSQLAGNQINIVGAGTSTITANIASTNNFNSGSVSNTLTVARVTTSISSINLPIKQAGSAPFTFSASTSNNTEVAITYSSSNTSTATVSGNTITIVGGGLSTISGSQVQTTNYTSGSISTTFIVIGLDAEYPNVNLYGANLAYSNFFSANFTNANLATSNLYYANLFDCDMVNADLSSTNLEGVTSGNIRGTPTLPTNYRMINGYIIGPKVSLQNANLVSQSITNANLFMSNLTNAQLISSNLTNTNLTSTNLTNANIYGTNLANANIVSTVLNGIISGQITGTPVLPINYLLINGFIIGENVNLSNVNLTIINTDNSTLSYNAFDDFISGPTAQSTSNNWQYFEVNTDRSTSTLISNWISSGGSVSNLYGQWGNYPFIQKIPTTGLIMHPSNGLNAGMGFKNNTNDTINVTVDISLSLLYPNSNTNGISYFIQRGLINDSRYVSYVNSSIPAKSSSIYTFNQSNIQLQIGEIIYLNINSNGDYNWDPVKVTFNVSINYFRSLNLSNVNFTNSNLSGTNFTNTNLTNATFLGANLTDVILANTTVTNTNFSNATLNRLISSKLIGTPALLPSNYSVISGYIIGPYVNLSSINLGNINITNANIFGTTIANAVISNAILNGVISGNLIGVPILLPTNYNLISGYIIGPFVNLNNANLFTSNFTNANLLGANINNINLSNATLNGLISGQLSGSPFALPTNFTTISGYFIGPSVNLTNASLTGANLTNANVYGATITNGSMSGTNLSGLVSGALTGSPSALPSNYSTISGYIIGPKVNLTNANLITSNLTNSNIVGATITNANLLNSTLNGLISGNLSGVPSSLPTNYTPISGYIIGPYVNLTSAVLTTSNLTNSNIYGVNITNALMSNTILDGLISGQLIGSTLSLPTNYSVISGFILGPKVNLTSAILTNSNLINANIYGATITNANIKNTTLVGLISGDLIGATTLFPSNYNLITGYIIGPYVNLTNANLVNSNLVNQNIYGVNITGANLLNSNINGLSSGELIGSPLSLPNGYSTISGYIIGPYTNLSSALLTNANLTNSNIYGVSLQNAVLQNTDLTGVISGNISGIPNTLPTNYDILDGYLIGPMVNLTDANLVISNLTNSNIYGATITNANLLNANFTRLISGFINGTTNNLPLDYSIISGYIIGPKVDLTAALLTTANLTNSNILGAIITNSNLSSTILDNVISGELIGTTTSLPINYQIQLGYIIGPNVNLANAILNNANLTNANIFTANLTNVNLSSANLTNANITGSKISNINLSNTQLNNMSSGELIGETIYLPPYYEINTGYIIGPFVNLSSANLSNNNLTNSNIYGSNVTNLNLSNAVLNGIISGQIVYSEGISLPTNYKMISGYIVGPSVNLTSANLSNSDLTNANIFNANLTNINLSNSILKGLISGNISSNPSLLSTEYIVKLGYIVGPFVSLVSANLENADLTNANIYGINISNANFSNVIFNGVRSGNIIGTAQSITLNYNIINDYVIGPYVNLFNSNLYGANLSNVILTGANMRNSNLSNAILTNTDLQTADLFNIKTGELIGTPFFPTSFAMVNGYIIGPNVNLYEANLVGANLTNTTLTNANMVSSDLSLAIIINAQLDGATLINANIVGANLYNTSFINSNLNGANLNGALVINTNFTNTDISGADISNISFTNVQKLQQQKNINNRDIPDIQLTSVPSEDILSQLSLSNTEDLADLSTISISVLLPSNSVVNISSFTGGAFYIPTSNNENIIINNRVFYSDGNIIRDAITNQIVTCLKINNKLYRLIPGSLIGVEVPLDEMYQFNGIGLNTVLDANNNNSKWINNYGNIYTNYTNMGVGIINPSYKIHTSGAVGATGFITTSDLRLKSNIRDIDDNSALNIVRLLTPKTYDYIDKVNNKTDTVYGFIAQEVSQVLPYTVDTISNFIPNLYTNVIIGNNVVYCLDRDIEFIIKDPNIVVYLKIYKSNKEIICRLATIINNRTFTIIESLEDGHYLLYGQMVDDFKTLKKDAIFTVCVAAMQEFYIVQSNLVSELINSKQKNQDLRSRLTYLETVIGNLIID